MLKVSSAPFTDKRTTILWLRWLLIIAVSYLMLFHTGKLVLTYAVSSLILFYIMSNLVLMLLPPKMFEKTSFDIGLIAGDSLIITLAMLLTGFSSSNLLLFYFLIILLTTLGKGNRAIVTNGLIMVGVYLVFLYQSQGEKMFEHSGLLLQIPFLVICTVFYGVLVNQEQRKRATLTEQIKRVSETMASQLSIKEIYQNTMDAMVSLLGADKCSIMLLDSDGQTLTLQDARGLDPQMIGVARQQVGEGIAGRVVKEGRPVLMNDFPLLTAKRTAYAKDIVSSVSVPLKVQDRVIGVLNMASLSRRRRFSKEDLDLLNHFAAEIATSIQVARLFNEVKGKNEEIKVAHLEVIQALAEAVESKDLYTGGHARRLAVYGDAMAHRAGLTTQEIELLWYAAILHDVGKIGIPDSILHNTGPLTPEQWVIMKTHPEKGELMLSQLGSLAPIAGIIRHHHERWDGKGYPDGVKGEAIPIYSRIIAIADTYDAVTTHRPYQAAVSTQEAFEILKNCAGTQLDPKLVEYFLAALTKSETLRNLCLNSDGRAISRG